MFGLLKAEDVIKGKSELGFIILAKKIAGVFGPAVADYRQGLLRKSSISLLHKIHLVDHYDIPSMASPSAGAWSVTSYVLIST